MRRSLIVSIAEAASLHHAISPTPNLDLNLNPTPPRLQQLTSTWLPKPTLVDCALLRRMIRQAMSTWEAANENIYFFEVCTCKCM